MYLEEARALLRRIVDASQRVHSTYAAQGIGWNEDAGLDAKDRLQDAIDAAEAWLEPAQPAHVQRSGRRVTVRMEGRDA